MCCVKILLRDCILHNEKKVIYILNILKLFFLPKQALIRAPLECRIHKQYSSTIKISMIPIPTHDNVKEKFYFVILTRKGLTLKEEAQ